MVARKSPVVPAPSSEHLKQLEILYARRSAIDGMIKLLMDYDRLRGMQIDSLKQKTA
jgi:hypothetical protein